MLHDKEYRILKVFKPCTLIILLQTDRNIRNIFDVYAVEFRIYFQDKHVGGISWELGTGILAGAILSLIIILGICFIHLYLYHDIKYNLHTNIPTNIIVRIYFFKV